MCFDDVVAVSMNTLASDATTETFMLSHDKDHSAAPSSSSRASPSHTSHIPSESFFVPVSRKQQQQQQRHDDKLEPTKGMIFLLLSSFDRLSSFVVFFTIFFACCFVLL